ncbi:hypothetical protein GLV94_16390 [Virgibacillus halodenitrificans]|uniref:ribonuclease YeeF family protein n=1 Tax=Virgibacillus halodenitrificans TaxID=1482 RepID=UPI00136D8CB3|nr:T7SS effector LXG polymorphic toxin [Virgibacillus halodenitrificans]MYL47225.1 hypothetical protein [Virgibacillus halodenitrificans]
MGNERLLESKTLVASMEDRAVQYESLKKQFVSLKNAFQKIVELDGFKGQGARAIKGFYQGQIEVVDSWISICNVRIAFFNGISGSTEDVDLSGETLVQVPFLKEELYTGHTQSKEMVDSQHKSLKSIFDRINDLVSLQPFSKEDFEEKIDQANKKRKDTMEQVANLDEGLVEEYASSEYLENMMVGLFSALLDATSQGSAISPINFDAQAYHNSDVYQMREDAQAQTDAYLEFKEQQEEQRRIQKEMEELENRPWYEKAWDTVSTFTGEVTGYYDMKRAATGVDPVTGEELSEADRIKAATFAAAGFIPFVGWAGRAAKGGNAIYKTAKGVQAVDHSLDVYKNAKAFTTLQKTEYGIYGLASANGFSEYITGKDMFGNQLSEEKRNSSLTEALLVLGVGGAGAYVDRLQAGNAVNSILENNNKYYGEVKGGKGFSKAELLNVTGLKKAEFDEIVSMPKGSRPDPSSYLSTEYIEHHLKQFEKGGSFIMTQKQYIRFVEGNDYIGCPDNTQFIAPKKFIDDIAELANGDITFFEKMLGFDDGHFLSEGGLVRFDIREPKDLNLRMPSGNEYGANSHWIPGGYTDGGTAEAIVDKIPNNTAFVDKTFIE